MIRFVTFILIGIYGSFKLAVSEGVQFPEVMTSYFSDLLCIPIVLGVSLMFMRAVRSNRQFYLSPGMIFYIWALYSFLFEYYLPTKSASFIADPYDVLMYTAGAGIFILLQISEKKKSLQLSK